MNAPARITADLAASMLAGLVPPDTALRTKAEWLTAAQEAVDGDPSDFEFYLAEAEAHWDAEDRRGFHDEDQFWRDSEFARARGMDEFAGVRL